MTLTGRLTGKNRADIEQQARDIAARYYDTKCVTVTLTNEEADTEQIEATTIESALRFDAGKTVFTANWIATIRHRSNNPVYGFPKCTRCGIELPKH